MPIDDDLGWLPRSMETPAFLPQEVVVLQILTRLPVASLLRLRRVCKAWRHAIDGDASFHRAHVRLQNPSVFIAVNTMKQGGISFDVTGCPSWTHNEVITAGLYRWDHEDQLKDTSRLVQRLSVHHSFPTYVLHETASLVQALSVHHSYPSRDYVLPDPAHCDGLLLLPANTTARLINPATRHVIELPTSTNLVAQPPVLPKRFRHRGYQAYGLGHDPASNTYKVARFFYRSNYTLGMEVCTVGRDQPQCWRETAEPPPYPISTPRAATFFKGSLLWSIDESLLLESRLLDNVPGYLRLKLEDESFSIMPLPPCCPSVHYKTSSLAELRGELCICVALPGESLEMWTCSDYDLDSDGPQWHRRHVLTGAPPHSLRLIAVFDEEIVFEFGPGYLLRFSRPGGAYKGTLMMNSMNYGDPRIGTLVDYASLHGYDVVPCVQSLIPL